jgi:hypothetical protein
VASKLVFVHLGKRFPSHLLANLEYCKRTFPHIEIVLIHNSPQSQLKKISGISLYEYKDNDHQVKNIVVGFEKNLEFRSKFWLMTKLRFLALADYVDTTMSSIVHIENDVWLAPYFNFEHMQGKKYSLAYPQVDRNRSIASVMFVDGAKGAAPLRDYTIRHPELSDMELLNLIRTESSDQVVSLLSSYNLLTEKDFKFNSGKQVFDGAAIGMYLFGADPRNSFGVLRRFIDFPGVEPKLSSLRFRVNEQKLEVVSGSNFLEISCLHVHSKTETLFYRNYEDTLKKILADQKAGRNSNFLFKSFIKSIIEIVDLAISKALRVIGAFVIRNRFDRL